MSRLVLIAIVSLFAGFSSAALAGEFVDEGLLSAEVLDAQAAGAGIDVSLDYSDVGDANTLMDRGQRERDMRDCRRRGDCYPRRRPSPRPAPGFTCYAESWDRQIYVGRDRFDVWRAQAEALDTCRAYSRSQCYSRGCERY